MSNLRCGEKLKMYLWKWLMFILTAVGIVSGFVIGFLVRLARPSESTLMWLGLPGQVFLNLLKMPIIPLIISSVITASATMDPKNNGKVGIIFLLLNVVSNFMGSAMGIILAYAIKPGQSFNEDVDQKEASTIMKAEDIAADMIRNLFPSNIVRATLQKAVTKYESTARTIEVNNSGILNSSIVYDVTKQVAYTDSMNVLGLLFGCIVFGIAAGQCKESGKAMLDFFQSVSTVVMVVLRWFLWFAPIGICSLIAESIASIEDISTMMVKLSLFVAAVLTGLAIHQLLIVPILYLILTRNNPFIVHFTNLKAWCLAFASASSAGAMPYLYETCAKFKMDDRVTAFGVPMAVTLNATGSSIFICCTVVFLTQVNQIALNFGQILTLFILTASSSMALPAAPSASIVLVVILCSTFSIPVESIGLLFTVEWLLDRLRTTSNVVAEIFILVTTWHFIKKDFENQKGGVVAVSQKIAANGLDIEHGEQLKPDSNDTLL